MLFIIQYKNGMNIIIQQGLGYAPTPVISYSAVERQAAGAVNITASHNPPWDSGFKVRDEHGAAVAPDGLREIESLIPPLEEIKRLDLEEARAQGRIRVWDPVPAYVTHIQKLVDIEPIKAAGLNILVEPMWGNGSGWFPRLLAGGRTQVTEIHNRRNPLFPEMARPEPIPPTWTWPCGAPSKGDTTSA
jgi:phosphomannomutase